MCTVFYYLCSFMLLFWRLAFQLLLSIRGRLSKRKAVLGIDAEKQQLSILAYMSSACQYCSRNRIEASDCEKLRNQWASIVAQDRNAQGRCW